MAAKEGPTGIGSLDWSKFDFTRWNLEGLPLEGGSATVTTLLQNAISSPQWPQSFGSSLPAIKTAVVQHLTLQAQALQERSAALDQQLAARVSQVHTQVTSVQAKLRTASVPASVAADPNKFQFVAKVLDQNSQLGLPGLRVQLSDQRTPGTVLASGTTDSNGNAIVSLTKDKAERLATDKADLTLTILNSAGKTLYTTPNVVCAHADHVETQVAAIAASADTAPALAVANRLNAADTALLNSLNAKVDQLKTAFAVKKQDLQTKIAQVQSTISAIQSELKPGANP